MPLAPGINPSGVHYLMQDEFFFLTPGKPPHIFASATNDTVAHAVAAAAAAPYGHEIQGDFTDLYIAFLTVIVLLVQEFPELYIPVLKMLYVGRITEACCAAPTPCEC